MMGRDERLTQAQRNKLYRQAKELKRKIRDSICTYDEAWIPSPENVQKFIKTDMRLKHEIRYFKDAMKAQGADPKEYDIERLRRK